LKNGDLVALKVANISVWLIVYILSNGFICFANSQSHGRKVLDKNEMRRRNQVMNVRSERNLLAAAESPWLVKLYCSFQDKDNLYFALEYLPGGDFMTLLQVRIANMFINHTCIT
jgi:serine/threonine protein kinase